MKGMTRGAVVTVALVAAAAGARAGEATLDTAGGSVYVTWTDGTRTIDYVHTPGGPWTPIEVVAKPGALPIIGVSHSAAGVVVHSGAGGSANLTAAAWVGVGAEASGTIGLRNPRTGQTTWPSAVRTIALDPTEPAGGTVLLDASHVLMADNGGQYRALALVRRSSGEAVLVDYDLASGPVRRTPLGFTPPIGSNKGSFVGTSDGHVWAAFASSEEIRLFDLGSLSAPGALHPVQVSALAVGGGFDPESTHLGIIAILIGLLAQQAPALGYQVGDELLLTAFDGNGFRTVARQSIPVGASGLMESEGIGYFLLPYLEQDNLYKQYGAFAPEPVLELPR